MPEGVKLLKQKCKALKDILANLLLWAVMHKIAQEKKGESLFCDILRLRNGVQSRFSSAESYNTWEKRSTLRVFVFRAQSGWRLAKWEF